jgi:hypothetical protein
VFMIASIPTKRRRPANVPMVQIEVKSPPEHFRRAV